MVRLILAIVIMVLVAMIALIARRWHRVDAPTQPTYVTPRQIDRTDFPRREAPWLVVAFTSDGCEQCALVWSKMQELASDEVAVALADFPRDRAIHRKYRIDVVPTTIIVDSEGVTRHSFLGPIMVTELVAAVAEAREPGSTSGLM